jgi:hypothetical protein
MFAAGICAESTDVPPWGPAPRHRRAPRGASKGQLNRLRDGGIPRDSLTLVGADSCRRRQLSFGHRVALELSLADAWALIGVGVDGVVAAVPGGGQGPVAACAEVVAPLDRCGLAVAEPVGTKLGGHASQE